jgi:hypothetical protein
MPKSGALISRAGIEAIGAHLLAVDLKESM